MVSKPSFLGNSAFMEPWCYNQIPSPPYLVPNYLHPHQYIPPPTPPPLFHYVQPPPRLYTPPFTLTCHTTLSTGQPFYAVETITSMTPTAATSDAGTVVADSQLMVAHQVFDESPATPTSNSDAAGDTSHRITNKIPEIIEKVGEGFADASRLIKEMPSNKVTLPSITPTSASIVGNLEDSGVDVIIASELDDGVGRSSVIGEVEIEMTVKDVGGQLVLNWVPVHGANVGFKGSGDDSSEGERFRRKGVSEVWGMLKDRDEEEGVAKKKGEVDDVENNDSDDDTSLFGYAMKVFDESPEPQLDIAAPQMFVESPEKVSSVKAAIPASQDTNSVFVLAEANKKAVKVNSPQQLLNNDKVMIYKLHENEYGKVLEENRKSNIDVDNRSVDDFYNLDTSKVNSQLESFSEGPRLAVSYFFNVKEHGCRHSYCTYLAIVKILCYKGMVRMLRTVLSEVVELSDSDCFDFEVSKLFDELSEEFKDEKQELLIHVVDVLVKVYVNLGKFDEAFDSIFRTKRRGYIPSILISNYLMNRLVECCKVSVKIFCLDREGRNMVIVIDAAEYIFKMSLLRKKYEHVMSMIGNSQLCGQAMISYLLQKGFSKVALHFVKDERTRFILALESGNIQTAVAATKEIDEKDHLYRLRVEALRQGNIEKLSKMLKIAEVKNGVMGQFHNALYLGDVQERGDSNITVHLLPAAKAIDGIIMMEVLQNHPSFDPHVAVIKDGYCKEGCSTITDSEILLLAGPTTVVTMINHAIGVAGVVSQECKAVVDQYGQKIMVMLLTEAPPEKICSQISLCTFDGTRGASVSIERVLEEISGMSSWHHDDMCSTCELTVAWMQNQMRQNPTQDRILSDVNELCDWLHRPMGESSVDRSKISTMPSVAFTIGDKIFKLHVKQYILKVGVLLIDTWDIKDLVALWSLGTEFKHTRNLSQQKEQPKTFIFEPILQRSDGCKPGGSFVQPSQFMVPFVTRMASGWYFSAMTLIFDPGGYDCYKIFKCYILEDKDDLKKWELLRTGPLD